MDTIVVANQSLYGEYVANVFAFSNIAAIPANFQTFADNFRTNWANTIAGGQSDSWSLDSLTFQVLGTDEVIWSLDVSFTAGPLVGGQTTDPVATQAALLCSLSYLGAKPNRGRVYLAAFTEASLNDSTWTLSVRSDAEAFVQGMIDGISDGSGDCFLRILRRPSAVFPAYVSNAVSAVVARPYPATIKRRRRQD